MQYCEKCRRLCEDGAAKCPGCRSGKLRPAGERDMAFLCQCNLYMAERLEQALTRADIPHKVEDAGKGRTIPLIWSLCPRTSESMCGLDRWSRPRRWRFR